MARPAFLLVLLALAACAPQPFVPPPLTVSDRAPIAFAVERVDVVAEPAVDGQPSYIEARLGTALEQAATGLLQQRLRADGGPGRVRALVIEAGLEEERLEVRGGLAGLFRREPDRRLQARLGARVEVYDERGIERAYAEAVASRARTVPQGADMGERDRIAYELIRDLIDDLDRGLEESVRANLGGFLAQ